MDSWGRVAPHNWPKICFPTLGKHRKGPGNRAAATVNPDKCVTPAVFHFYNNNSRFTIAPLGKLTAVLRKGSPRFLLMTK